MKKCSFVALLLVGATILGSTVLREPIARAAQSLDATIVGPLDGQGNVKVHEQGTANVREQNLDRLGDIKVHEQGRVSTRSDNDEVSITKRVSNSECSGLLYTVPYGKQLVLEYISAWTSAPGAEGGAIDVFSTGQEPSPTLPFVFEPQAAGESASETVHYVLGQGANLFFISNPPFPPNCDFFVSLGGYLK
jgi:hypothetical protein